MENKDKIYSIEDLNINQNTMICIFSKSNSGKTVLIRNLLEYLFNKYDFHSIIMFSDTAQYDDDYSFLNKKNIFTSDQIESKLKKILQLQKKNMLSNKDINLLLNLLIGYRDTFENFQDMEDINGAGNSTSLLSK